MFKGIAQTHFSSCLPANLHRSDCGGQWGQPLDGNIVHHLHLSTTLLTNNLLLHLFLLQKPVSPVAGGGKSSMQGYVEACGKVGGLFLPNGPQLPLHLTSSFLLFIPLLDIFTQIYVWLQTRQNNLEHRLQCCMKGCLGLSFWSLLQTFWTLTALKACTNVFNKNRHDPRNWLTT